MCAKFATLKMALSGYQNEPAFSTNDLTEKKALYLMPIGFDASFDIHKLNEIMYFRDFVSTMRHSSSHRLLD